MAKTSLPPGFRFHPTDIELILYYLKRKVTGKRLQVEAISEVDLYKFAPWDLPAKSCLKSRDLEWYFYCPRDKKYASGPRANRATDIGYWKTTGKDRCICHNSRTVGMKKTLIFHIGRAPSGERTDWVMHEYRLDDKQLADAGFSQDAYVLCKLFKKSGPGPKNGEQYGAPFDEDEWEDDVDNDAEVFNPQSSLKPMDVQPSSSEPVLQPLISAGGNQDNLLPDSFDIEQVLLQLSSDDDIGSSDPQGNTCHEMPTLTAHESTTERTSHDASEIFSGLEDLVFQNELYPVDGTCFPNQTDYEYKLQQTLFGFDSEPYLELRDLGFPMGDDGSQLDMANGLLGNPSNSENLNTLDIPTFPAYGSLMNASKVNNFGGNANR